LAPNSPELLLLKFLVLTYISTNLKLHTFFHNGVIGGCTLFYSWAVFGLDSLLFVIACCKAGQWLLVLVFFSFVQAAVWSAVHVYHVYFSFKICMYVFYRYCTSIQIFRNFQLEYKGHVLSMEISYGVLIIK